MFNVRKKNIKIKCEVHEQKISILVASTVFFKKTKLLKCRKNTDSKNQKFVKTKNGRRMV